MKLAIVKSQRDLLRVIGMPKASIIEWKIVPLFGEYSMEYWEQASLHLQEYTTSSEVTYHSSKVGVGKVLPGIVHVKEVEGGHAN